MPDNPLFVPETGRAISLRALFYTLGDYSAIVRAVTTPAKHSSMSGAGIPLCQHGQLH
jgi:hypothetical protein